MDCSHMYIQREESLRDNGVTHKSMRGDKANFLILRLLNYYYGTSFPEK